MCLYVSGPAYTSKFGHQRGITRAPRLGVPQLRIEAKEKLSRIRPANFGQAGRISGICPADLAVLLMYLE